MRNWVKVKGSDKEIYYPHSVRINHPDGSWHYEDDETKPKVRRITPTLVEDHGDGTYTFWSYSVWGPIGETGKLREDIELVPLKTKADFAEAERLEKMLERAMRSQGALAGAMFANKLQGGAGV